MVAVTNNHRTPPGMELFELLRMTPRFRKDALASFTDSALRFGDVVRFKGLWTSYQLSHPDHIEHVLQTKYQNYPKSWNYKVLKNSLGEGLLISEGEVWRRQRRLAQPAFHRQRIAAFARVMTDSTEVMLAEWRAHAERGQPIDVAKEMMRLTLRIVGQTLFSVDLSREADVIGRLLGVGREHALRRMYALVKLPENFPTPRNITFRRVLREADKIIYGMINERRRAHHTGTKYDDLLSMLISARDEETGEGMSDGQLRTEALTLVIAGHETTTNALAWTLYLLALHPAIERKLRDEFDSVLSGREATADDIPKLKYTMMVIEESMRLYPPVWALSRTAKNEDEIGGYHIEAGAMIMLFPYVTHRHPAFWENPEEFDPERFTPERTLNRPRYAYFPFGGGPRQCIGNNFAMMEAQLILATVMQRFRLRLVPEHKVELEASITLRPRHGILMTLDPL